MIGVIYMKFKLIEKFDETRDMVQEYMYDAMDELNNASLEEYIQWFKSELTYYDDVVERAVKDAYIEACDYGMIKGVEKTRLTSELKEYIESHTDVIDDTEELMRQCPEHLQYELKIVLSKLDESLNEELLIEATRAPRRIIYEARFDTPEEKDAIEIFCDDYDKFKELLDKYRRRIKTVTNIKVHLLKFVKKTYKFPDIGAPFTISDANQIDSHVPQSFRKSIDANKVDISNNKQERLLAIWERNHYTDGKIESVDKYHSKITFE